MTLASRLRSLSHSTPTSPTTMSSSARLAGIKALFFDVFGTTVDWRTTVTRELHARCQKTSSLPNDGSIPRQVHEKASRMQYDDWARFAEEWRQMYYQFTREVAAAAGEGDNEAADDDQEGTVYKTIDDFQLESLGERLEEWGLTGLWSKTAVEEISRVWHRLDPWPDSVEGLKALNEAGLQTCTLSNGNVELLADMARHAGLPWMHVFSAEMFKSYKPNPKVYLGAAKKVGLKPEECAMVACHLGDLDAARRLGLATVYVQRPQEEAWQEQDVEKAKEWVDLWVGKEEQGFISAANRLQDKKSTWQSLA